MTYEDFTAYTEVDPNNKWSQTSTRNTGANIKGEDSYVYKDYTLNFFGDYTHQVDIWANQVVIGTMETIVWGVTNNPASFTDMVNGQIVTMGCFGSAYRAIRLRDKGNAQVSADYVFSSSTWYYLTIQRIGTVLTCKIYSDSARTNLLDTLSITCETTQFRYLEIGGSYDSGTGTGWSGLSEKLNLGLPETVLETDTLSLADDLSFRFIVEIEESLGLAENFAIGVKDAEIDETLTISEQLEANINLVKYQPDITLPLSDEIIAGYMEIEDLDNDFRSVIQEIEDVNNKINIASEVIEDIDNKFSSTKVEIKDIIQKLNTAKLELDDMRMAFHMAYDNLPDVNNKFNMRGQSINDITNDFRMRLSWQVAGDLGIQSLGKEYLKVYFDDVEITDVDIDSLKITKNPGTSHTATLDLERTYDANRPSLEATVLIKYNGILIYKGYISSINPTDTPEKIQINCKDEYWLDNRNKIWFDIGHQPSDDAELYYNTFSEGLSAIGVNFGIGSFIPQAVSLFGSGRSNAISAMVQNSGNFDWYYDEDDNKKLWTANGGSIINLEAQELAENLELFQVLSHNISDSAENIVNKLRVQMGDQIIRHPGRQGETRTYTSRIIGVSRVRAVPMWESSQEVLAKDSGTGFGFDYHPGSSSYDNVFKKFRIINPTLESWSDYRPPVVEVTRPFGSGSSIPSATDGILEQGFSVDFKEGILTLNEPLYYYNRDGDGEITNIYSPTITLIIYRQTYVTRTETDADDPEIDITNDLMFFTDKVGTYPTTVLETLNLSGLSIAGGGVFITSTNTGDNVHNFTPTWDDTNFANDIAYWKLSETADKKISGTIKLTLDACIFYGIELNKRIMVDGILDSPLNITSLTYNMNDFTVDIDVESFRYFKRTVSIPSHGEGMSTTSIKTYS